MERIKRHWLFFFDFLLFDLLYRNINNRNFFFLPLIKSIMNGLIINASVIITTKAITVMVIIVIIFVLYLADLIHLFSLLLLIQRSIELFLSSYHGPVLALPYFSIVFVSICTFYTSCEFACLIQLLKYRLHRQSKRVYKLQLW